jgi:hypothetical protein
MPSVLIQQTYRWKYVLDDRGLNCPVNLMDGTAVKKNRWPVPEPYWYHPLFDEDWDPIPPCVGRVNQ